MDRSFNEHFDIAQRLGQIIQGESGAVDPVSFARALDVLSEFDVSPKKRETAEGDKAP